MAKILKKDIKEGSRMFTEFLNKYNTDFQTVVDTITKEKRYAKDPVVSSLWYLSHCTGYESYLQEQYDHTLLDSHILTALKQIKNLIE